MAIVNGTPGADPTLVGTEENDTINAGAGNDGINALGGNDVINPGSGDDAIDAGSGDDTINAGGGEDTVDGGAGVDQIVFSNDLEIGDTFDNAGDAFADTFNIRTYGIDNVETLVFSNGTFDLTTGANQFFAENGATATANGAVSAAGDSDGLLGIFNAAAASITAVATANIGTTAGQFRITEVNGQAPGAGGVVTLESGARVTVTGAATYTFTPPPGTSNNAGNTQEAFTLTFTNGLTGDSLTTITQTVINTDTADTAFQAAAGGSRLEGDSAAETFNGAIGNDSIFGNGGNDTIDADAGAPAGFGGDDFISAGGGDDSVDAGAGNDQVFAGAGDTGNDTFNGEEGNDTLGGGAGNDTLNGGTGSDVLFGGSGNDVLTTGGTLASGVEQAFAGTGSDTLTGGAGNDILGGGAGSDTVAGGAGNDLIFGGAADIASDVDTLDGGAGNDTIFGGNGADSVVGGTGNDQLFNGAGNDTVLGGDGADEIFGGAGNDQLTGNLGNDTFFFEAGNGSDTITDLGTTATTNPATTNFDVIDLSGTTFDFANLSDVVDRVVDPTTANALIDLGGGDFLTLTGFSAAQIAALDPSQFVF